MSNVQWTEKTWNPVVGCSKVSAGCHNCYAIPMAHRLASNPKTKGAYQGLTEKTAGHSEWTGTVRFLKERLQIPLQARKPTRWFVNSMSDLFHESVSDEEIDLVFAVMALTPQHTYQLLTKRPERMLSYLTRIYAAGAIQDKCRTTFDSMSFTSDNPMSWPLPNVWIGVTVEDQKTANDRIPMLLQATAAVRFVSCEPLLEEVDLSGFEGGNYINPGFGEGYPWLAPLRGYSFDNEGYGNRCPSLDWVIVGGESGRDARAFYMNWAWELVGQCREAGTPIFMKQFGSNVRIRNRDGDESASGFTGKGDDMDEWPEWAKVREYPIS